MVDAVFEVTWPDDRGPAVAPVVGDVALCSCTLLAAAGADDQASRERTGHDDQDGYGEQGRR